MHTTSLHELEAGIRNEALSLFLSKEKAKQEELNRKLQTAHDQLRQLSMTDDLTGLWNRRFLNATIPEDVAQVVRNYHNVHKGLENLMPINIDIVFLILDLDHFKVVNDTYGHGAGDQVLIQIRQLLTEFSRDTDNVIRWGGDEFLVVARNSRRSNYMVLVERIRRAVESHQFDIGMEKPLRLTCSIGAAVFPFLSTWPEALSWDRVVELADACLYAAKRSGRNAWVGIIPTGLAVLDDLTPHLAEHLPDLLQEGKLEMKTSLPDDVVICWTD
jgi:diguanylate cyclase (GGDEF)-like protein